MNFRILLSVIPVLLFLGMRQVAPAWSAIVISFAATAGITWLTRRDRLLGVLTVYGFAITAAGAVVGIAWNSEKAYLAAGPLSDLLFVPLYVGSVLVGRPLIGGIASELAPALVHEIPPDAPVYRWLSLAWAAYNLVQAVLRAYLLAGLSVNEYLIISRLLNLPLTGGMMLLTGGLIWRAVRQHRGASRPTLAPEPA